MLTSYEIARLAVQALDEKKAKDITVLKTEKALTLAGEPPLRREGYRSGNWVLLDFGCVVVHVFLEDTREFYGLERLWADAQAVDYTEMLH